MNDELTRDLVLEYLDDGYGYDEIADMWDVSVDFIFGLLD